MKKLLFGERKSEMAEKRKRLRHTMNRDREMVLATGNSNRELAQAIADYLSTTLADIEVTRFSDGESRIIIKENMRGQDLYIIQSLCNPVNENIMDMLIMTDAGKRASARRVIAVIPYYGYARQDKKQQPREPITAKMVADLIEKVGVKRVMSMDLHAASIQGFFSIPVDHLSSLPVVVAYLKENKLGGEDTMMVSPDVGGVVRTRMVAEKINSSIAILSKRRPRPNVAEVAELIGSVKGMRCVMIDDMVDTAGTLTKGSELLMEHGATEVRAICTHGVLSGESIPRIEKSPLIELVITDTIPLSPEKRKCTKIKVISVADVFGEAIIRNFEQRSISELFM